MLARRGTSRAPARRRLDTRHKRQGAAGHHPLASEDPTHARLVSNESIATDPLLLYSVGPVRPICAAGSSWQSLYLRCTAVPVSTYDAGSRISKPDMSGFGSHTVCGKAGPTEVATGTTRTGIPIS